MQKVFDTDNADDMGLLWSILPDEVYKIENRFEDYGEYYFKGFKSESHIYADLILIDWHDKTEITRPISEATEADIGKLCRFSLSEKARCSISIIEEHDMFGILTEINNNSAHTLYLKDRDIWFNHCRRLTKQEIEELC